MNKNLATLLILLVFAFLSGGRGTVASAQSPMTRPLSRYSSAYPLPAPRHSVGLRPLRLYLTWADAQQHLHRIQL